MPKKTAIYLIILMVPLLIIGCGKTIKRTYVRENVDLAFVKKIAILPLENNTSEKFVPNRVRNSIATQVMSKGLFEVVDKGLVDNAFLEEALNPGSPVDLNSIKRLGQRLNVQAFIIGSVDEAGEGRKGNFSFPMMSLTLRLVEAEGGLVLWQSNGHRVADSTMARLFGFTAKDSFYNTDKLIKGMLKTIPR